MKTFRAFIKNGYDFPFVAEDMAAAKKKMKKVNCEIERIELVN